MFTQMAQKITMSNVVKPIFIGGILTFSFFTQNVIKNITLNYTDKTQIKINLPKFNFEESGNNLIIVNSTHNNDDAVERSIKHEIELVKADLNKKEIVKVIKKQSKKIVYKTIITRTVEPVEIKVADQNDYEINNKEIFTENRLSIQINEVDYKVAWAKNFEKMSSQIFSNLNKVEPVKEINTVSITSKPMQIEEITKDEPQQDEVNEVASSIDKKDDSDLTLFDYSKTAEQTTTAAITVAPKPQQLSNTVMSVIHREKENINSLTTQKPKWTFNYRNIQNTEKAKKTAFVPANQVKEEAEPLTNNSFKLSVKTFELNFETGVTTHLTNFNFRPNYQEADAVSDNYEGVVVFEGKLNSEYSILSGTLSKAEYMPIKVDFVIEKDETEYSVPMISESVFNDYIDNNKLSGKGGNVLLQLNESIKSVGFDKKYEKKVLLDKKMSEVTDMDSAEYVLFLGIDTGNALMEVITINGKIVSKVTNIEEAKINFDIINIEAITQSIIALNEKRLLSEKEKELSIDESKVTLFNTNIKGKSTGALNNRYEFLDYFKFLGEREYFEFEHLSIPIFVGKNKSVETLELPNEEYISQVFKSLNVDDLDSQCIAQINLNKKLKNSQMEITTQNGPGPLNISYYDNDGTFNNEITDYTSKVYITGDMQGAVNVKLEYVDGTVDYLRTFCSIGSYVIEQN